MYCLGRDLTGISSILSEFAISDYDESHIGRRSEPFMTKVDQSAVEKVAYASGCAVPWHTSAEQLSNGNVVQPIAAIPFYWYLVNNTPTYRAYETTYVMGDVMKQNDAHLHTGDDYRYYEPITVGDTITVVCELSKVYEKQGRQGRMKFIEDIWEFRNQRNVLVGDLVRKAVTIYAEGTSPQPKPDFGPDLAEKTRCEVKTLPRRAWDHPDSVVDLFDGKEHAYRQELGPITWTSMIQWMGAVDDYAKTHYDWDYARERGFPGGVPITAGPQMGAAMLAPLVAWAGRNGWIEEFRHIQRRQVNPGDVLTTYGFSKPTEDPDRVVVEAWLVDDQNRIRNTGVFTVRRWTDAPVGPASRLWTARSK
ncbi:MaoC family dehydratase N-terminal domain-containing protein [Chelativorans sp. Marseille-P2723]|uniref:FAS1-like dehydratase domain-containing protein n=1 Tax=Chelativorans sp. Marseille-P2723 TaxID=2709133 RepID=UPI00156E5D96|nr:MaoC family dehydratase N-terminal domain-containing protein [Chelativorans sp. Marseille-P2723]